MPLYRPLSGTLIREQHCMCTYWRTVTFSCVCMSLSVCCAFVLRRPLPQSKAQCLSTGNHRWHHRHSWLVPGRRVEKKRSSWTQSNGTPASSAHNLMNAPSPWLQDETSVSRAYHTDAQRKCTRFTPNWHWPKRWNTLARICYIPQKQEIPEVRCCVCRYSVCMCVCDTLKVMMICVKWNSASKSSWMVTFSTPETETKSWVCQRDVIHWPGEYSFMFYRNAILTFVYK